MSTEAALAALLTLHMICKESSAVRAKIICSSYNLFVPGVDIAISAADRKTRPGYLREIRPSACYIAFRHREATAGLQLTAGHPKLSLIIFGTFWIYFTFRSTLRCLEQL